MSGPAGGRPPVGPIVAVRLPEPDVARADDHAARVGVTRAELLRTLLLDGLDALDGLDQLDDQGAEVVVPAPMPAPSGVERVVGALLDPRGGMPSERVVRAGVAALSAGLDYRRRGGAGG